MTADAPCRGRIDAMPRRKLTPIEKAAKALARLSDAEWVRVKSVEDQRRADQHTIRGLSRELRERKGARRHRGGDPDMQISRIRLSDKTSRLHPRHVVPKRSQADEPEVPPSSQRVNVVHRVLNAFLRRPVP